MSRLSLAAERSGVRQAGSAPTCAADLDDQRWLDRQVEAIETGVDAVVNIARNWTDGRNLARLHPGVSAAEYVTSRVGTLGKAVVPVLLAESNWSNRQIAAVAGVTHPTVAKARREVESTYHVEPRPVLGADGKTYPPRVVAAVVIDEPAPSDAAWDRLEGLMRAMRGIAALDARAVADAVPERRRAGTARTLRSLGTSLGAIALALEEGL